MTRNVFLVKAITAYFLLSVAIISQSCNFRGNIGYRTGIEKTLIGVDFSFNDLLLSVPRSAKFTDNDFHIWGGSMIQTADGKCHLFYSRWPIEYPHLAWVSHSEISYAIADNPLGPYTHMNVALPPRGKDYWDGMMTHNPTIHKFGDKYFLYYVGNTGDGNITQRINHIHRNNQRIGVATADHPAGPWARFDTPLIDVSPDRNASDALMVSNPAIIQKPEGGYLMVYKAAGIDTTRILGGRVVHRVAESESPTGPFSKYPGLVFDEKESSFPAEDPYIWHQGDRYLAIVKDMHGAFTDAGTSLVLFESFDGIDWDLAPKPLVSRIELTWENGTTEKLSRLERPQLFFENGRPKVLFLAAAYNKEHSFNIHIPLSIEY
jgi:hypothetical protein